MTGDIDARRIKEIMEDDDFRALHQKVMAKKSAIMHSATSSDEEVIAARREYLALRAVWSEMQSVTNHLKRKPE